MEKKDNTICNVYIYIYITNRYLEKRIKKKRQKYSFCFKIINLYAMPSQKKKKKHQESYLSQYVKVLNGPNRASIYIYVCVCFFVCV